MTDGQFKAWLARLDKPESYAREARYYGDPANAVKFEREKGVGMLQRAKKVEVVETFAKREPIDKVLDIWASYMSLRDSSEPGGYAHEQDVKEFMRLGEAVDAMVNSLKRHQWWAVRKSKGICTQWIFQDAIYEDALLQAKEILIGKMKINVATARYFN